MKGFTDDGKDGKVKKNIDDDFYGNATYSALAFRKSLKEIEKVFTLSTSFSSSSPSVTVSSFSLQ